MKWLSGTSNRGRFRIPIKYSPLIYPIDVKAMFETPGVEYHEGALRYYADHHLNQKAA